MPRRQTCLPGDAAALGLFRNALYNEEKFAPDVQVSRWGLPLITNIFMPDMKMREDYNRAAPAEDLPRFSPQISQIVAGFNGQGLADDVMDVMLSLTTNTALGDCVAPDQRRMRAEFPHFGEPYATSR